MKQEVKGYFYACFPTTEGYYDLYLFLSGQPRWVIGMTREELARVFEEAGEGSLLTVKI